MKENQIPTGGTDRLPLVGSEATTEHQLLNTKTSNEGKPNTSGRHRPPPAGRQRSNTRVSALKHKYISWRQNNRNWRRRPPPVGRPRKIKNPIRKETPAAGCVSSRPPPLLPLEKYLSYSP